MMRIILVTGFIVFLTSFAFGQANKEKLDKIKAIELRSNSRDITPVRKTNLHRTVDIRKQKAINNAKRMELRKKRQQFQRQKLLQNRKRMMQLQRIKRKKATMRRNRR